MNFLRNKRSLFLVGVTSIGLVLVGWLYTNILTSYPTSLDIRLLHTDIAAVSKGKLVYEQNCASCHGKKARGASQLAPT